MHMISKTDLNFAEMEKLTKSCSPTIVLTANGEVQTHEEATVCVKELYLLLTMKVLENTPVVLSLGKLCDENGYSYERINGQKPHLIKTVFGYSATRRTSFRLSASCSSSLPSSASMTPSRQESDHPTSSSSSSTPPPLTSSTVSSDSVARQER